MHAISLHCNFCRIHKSLKVTPVIPTGVTDAVYGIDWIVDLVDDATPPPGSRGPYRPRNP